MFVIVLVKVCTCGKRSCAEPDIDVYGPFTSEADAEAARELLPDGASSWDDSCMTLYKVHEVASEERMQEEARE